MTKCPCDSGGARLFFFTALTCHVTARSPPPPPPHTSHPPTIPPSRQRRHTLYPPGLFSLFSRLFLRKKKGGKNHRNSGELLAFEMLTTTCHRCRAFGNLRRHVFFFFVRTCGFTQRESSEFDLLLLSERWRRGKPLRRSV